VLGDLPLPQRLGIGLVAGATGAAALNVVSYCDMLLRGRPASEVPAKTAQLIAKGAGISALDAGDAAENRREAAGALMGYADGLGTGAAYGLVRQFAGALPWQVGALALTAATLVAGEGTATRVGATDWSQWTVGEWIADLVPRFTYGAVTAWTYDALAAVVT